MRAAIFVAEGVEDMEFFYPYFRLKEEGVTVDVVSNRSDAVTGKHGYTITPTTTVPDVRHENYDIVILPGGKAPERLRVDRLTVERIKAFFDSGTIIAAICHGAQLLISAGVLDGKNATCVRSIKDDIVAAGAHYADEPVVIDKALITSRVPDDLPDFCRAILTAAHKRMNT